MKEFQKSVVYKLHRLVYRMDILANIEMSQQTQLNYNDFLVFLALRDNPESNQDNLSQWTQLNKSTISKILDKLFKKNLLTRTENLIDRRLKNYTITPQGEKELLNAEQIASNIASKVFASIELTELENFSNTLENLNNKL